MENKELSDQSKRLAIFVEQTGMSLLEFGKQCGIKSPRTMTQIIKDGSIPSTKVLDKIVNRFPGLNKDWVSLGYGKMIIEGYEKHPSPDSTKASTNAGFNQIKNYLENHNYSLNELGKDYIELKQLFKDQIIIDSQRASATTNKIDKIVLKAEQYVEKHQKENERGMNAALDMITNFEQRSNIMMSKMEKMMDTIVKSQKEADARSDESLKAGLALVASIEETKKQGMIMMKAVHDQSNKALELGERALKENKLALKSFGRGLEGYAKERDKKAEEITLVNVEKLFKQLIEMRVKGIGDFSKVKKN